MMGIARPGIAPTHGAPLDAPESSMRAPMQANNEAQQPAPGAPFDPQNLANPRVRAPAFITAPPAPRAASSRPPAETVRPNAPPNLRTLAMVVASVAGLIIVIALAVFVSRGRKPVAVRASLRGEASAPQLELGCDHCDDGTELDLGDGHKAIFSKGVAVVSLGESNIHAGRNEFRGTLTQRPSGHSSPVLLEVAIPALAHTSLAPLVRGDSAIDVTVEVPKEVRSVSIDGQDESILDGRATRRIAIPKPSDDERIFDRTIAYETVEADPSPGDSTRSAHKGSLKVSVRYAPLHLGLPGRHPLILRGSDPVQSLEVTGRTAPLASVSLGSFDDAKGIAADKDGLLRGRVPFAPDQTSFEVRAFGAKWAPRTVTVTVVRDDAKSIRGMARIPFEKIAKDPGHFIGEWSVVTMHVEQTGEEDGRGVAVGDAKCASPSGCPPLRVLLPAGAVVTSGDEIEVIGVVVRGVPLAKEKATAVELDGSIILKLPHRT
ncbi:MAG: hypothetical protein NVS3B20_03000 [Polyangiales bacterium]